MPPFFMHNKLSTAGVGGGGAGGDYLGAKIMCEIILSIIAISGIIGNIISIYVFSRPKMVSSIIYRILIGKYFMAISVMNF